ncbi:MAG: hypothetical protein QXO71_12225 [Candidatus Jordarchaeaceae archaeon]
MEEAKSSKAEFYGEELMKFLEKNESKVVEYLDNIAQESKVVKSNILKFICHRRPELGQRLIQHLIQKHQDKLEIVYIQEGVEEIFTKNPKLFFDMIEEHINSPAKWRQKLVTDLLEIISETVLKLDKEVEEKARKETLLGLNRLLGLLGLRE